MKYKQLIPILELVLIQLITSLIPANAIQPNSQTLVGRWEGKQLGSQTTIGTALFQPDGKAYFFTQSAEVYLMYVQQLRNPVSNILN